MGQTLFHKDIFLTIYYFILIWLLDATWASGTYLAESIDFTLVYLGSLKERERKAPGGPYEKDWGARQNVWKEPRQLVLCAWLEMFSSLRSTGTNSKTTHYLLSYCQF